MEVMISLESSNFLISELIKAKKIPQKQIEICLKKKNIFTRLSTNDVRKLENEFDFKFDNMVKDYVLSRRSKAAKKNEEKLRIANIERTKNVLETVTHWRILY